MSAPISELRRTYWAYANPFLVLISKTSPGLIFVFLLMASCLLIVVTCKNAVFIGQNNLCPSCWDALLKTFVTRPRQQRRTPFQSVGIPRIPGCTPVNLIV